MHTDFIRDTSKYLRGIKKGITPRLDDAGDQTCYW